jgi:hypothetical protein
MGRNVKGVGHDLRGVIKLTIKIRMVCDLEISFI